MKKYAIRCISVQLNQKFCRNGLAPGDLGIRVQEGDENVDDDSGEVFGTGLVDGEEARDEEAVAVR